MSRRAFFFRIGEFSLINDALVSGLIPRLDAYEWKVVDVEKDIVSPDKALYLRATAEAGLRYGRTILSNRQPPRDFFPRIPAVIEAVRDWVRRHVDPRDSAFVLQTQSLFDARREGLPHFLYTDHTYLANLRYPTPKPLLPVAEAWKQMERDLYTRANCSFVSSGFAAESLREDYHVPEERLEVVFSGSNVSAGVPGDRQGRIVLFVGVDWERKGGPELLTAFREVRQACPEAELWIVGCTPETSDAGVKVLGRRSPEEVARYYARADIFCLPSRMDPSASVLAEASSYELPIVATPVGGNLERVEHGVSGFLAEPEALGARLIELLRSPELRREFGRSGRKLMSKRFTWEAVCDKMARRIRKEVEK